MNTTFAIEAALLAAHPAAAGSTAAPQFQREHPCPATGEPRGPCPGWIRDHIVALACGAAPPLQGRKWGACA